MAQYQDDLVQLAHQNLLVTQACARWVVLPLSDYLTQPIYDGSPVARLFAHPERGAIVPLPSLIEDAINILTDQNRGRRVAWRRRLTTSS